MSKIQIAPTLIDVMVRHEQQIQELKRLLTPMMEFNPEKPLTYDSYDSPGPSYQHVQYPPDPPKEWVGLTGPEVDEAYRSVSDKEWAIGGLADARVFFCAIEAKLKQKNGGDSAIDTELQRLGYPL